MSAAPSAERGPVIVIVMVMVMVMVMVEDL
jgi:hypothetical protein